MFNFYKKKNFRKIYILLGISITLFLCIFLNQNLSIKNVLGETNKDLFSKKLLVNYNSFFEIKKVTLNGRSKSNLDSIKKIVNSSLDKNKNIINYDISNIRNSLEEINWINKVFIRKIFPNKINIGIEEHKEFAIFNKNEKSFLNSDVEIAEDTNISKELDLLAQGLVKKFEKLIVKKSNKLLKLEILN